MLTHTLADIHLHPYPLPCTKPCVPRWGYLSRAGLNDKSQLNRQIEKYADIYTSRVSNFLRYTPYSYFRYAHVLSLIMLIRVFQKALDSRVWCRTKHGTPARMAQLQAAGVTGHVRG